VKKILVAVLVACLAGVLAACNSPAGELLSGQDREAVLAFSEAETDNLMSGLNSGDYAVFSKDFDKNMLNALTESSFRALRGERNAKLGKYVSRTVQDVYKTNRDFYTVIYNANFEKQEDVVMRVVFHTKEPYQVSGLWFNQ
jgi:predicted small secreted protein